jgi:outer membrane protein W
MRHYKILSVIVLGAVLVSFQAWAGPSFSLVGDAIYSKPYGTGVSADTKAKIGYGGGLLAEFRLSPRVGMELGGLYLMRNFHSNGALLTSTVVQAPLLFRYWFGRVVSMGLGGYYSTAIGDNVKSKVDGTTTDVAYSSLGFKKTDYGAVGSLGFSFRLSNSAAFLIDARYTYGLADIDTNTEKDRYQDAHLLIGLRFGGMK